MKLLHAADFHLDAPFAGRSGAEADLLRRALLSVPEKVARCCREQGCDLLLLSGDLFDGTPGAESIRALKAALTDAGVPVFISPGNHDFCGPNSPWVTEAWPENVHIFSHPAMESVALPELDCRVYGAGYRSMDCAALLEGFRTAGREAHHIAVLHGDATQKNSPYCPISQAQVAGSGLDYLALGHIHKTGSFRAGGTLCAWPGCPMGRGFDEVGEKGVLLVTLEETVRAEFLPLDGPRFYDLEAAVLSDPADAVAAALPPVENGDFYRVTLTGEAAPFELGEIASRFSAFPHLELRDRTLPAPDLWGAAGNDSLEGVYFRLLQDTMEAADGEARQIAELAARISRKILDGREVTLP